MRRPRRVIRTLSAEEARALVAQPDVRAAIGLRDREAGTVKVLGKGQKERVVGLSSGVVSELRPYLRRRPAAPGATRVTNT
jgi:site-specific recombinase XerD